MRTAQFAIVMALMVTALPNYAQPPDSAIASIVNVLPMAEFGSKPKLTLNGRPTLRIGNSVKVIPSKPMAGPAPLFFIAMGEAFRLAEISAIAWR